MTNYPRLSPVDRARVPNGPLDRLGALEASAQQLQQGNVAGVSVDEFSTDVWALNTSFPALCQGRFTVTSGAPAGLSDASGNTIFFTPYIGNLIGTYNGTTWDQLPFSELSLPVLQTQTGTLTNTQPQITGLTDTSQMVVGQGVSGTNIPATATILSIDSASQVTMNINATGSGATSITFWITDLTIFDIYIVNTGGGVLALRPVLWNKPLNGAITNVTNASPPVVTTASTTGLNTDDIVWIRSVGGATPVNDVTWRVGTVTGTTFQLKNQSGTNGAAPGVYTSGGQWIKANDYSAASGHNDRAVVPVLQDGIYVLPSNHTWRYLGTAVTNAYDAGSGGRVAIIDMQSQRGLWNYYNRKYRPIKTVDVGGGASWASASANVWLFDHNNTGNRIPFVVGIWEDDIAITKKVSSTTLSGAEARSGPVFDGDLINGPAVWGNTLNGAATGVRADVFSQANTQVGVSIVAAPGFHALVGEEWVSNIANASWQGSTQYLLSGYIWG